MLAKADHSGCVSGNKEDKSELFDYTLDDAGVPANMEAVPELMPAVRDAYATVVDAIAII